MICNLAYVNPQEITHDHHAHEHNRIAKNESFLDKYNESDFSSKIVLKNDERLSHASSEMTQVVEIQMLKNIVFVHRYII